MVYICVMPLIGSVDTAPDLIVRFGGHALAAGLTIQEKDLERFSILF